MAQENLDLGIRALTEGMNDVARLINEVGSLRTEVDRLRATSTNAASGVRRFNNALDEQSKAIRNTRQGMQQAGMQINDFFTSVSTGASPVQAFNQQIGQVGYALSMMEGKVGAVGRFLAGPWSIAIIGAAMILGPYIEKMFTLGQSAEETKKAMENLTQATNNRIESEYNVRLSLAKTAQEYRNIRMEMLENIRIMQITALGELDLALARQASARAATDEIANRIKNAGSARGSAEMATGTILEQVAANSKLASSTKDLIAKTTAVEQLTQRLNMARVGVIEADKRIASEANKAADAQNRSAEATARKAEAEAERIKRMQDTALERVTEFVNKYTSVSTSIGSAKNQLDDFNKAVNEMNPLQRAGMTFAIEETRMALEELIAGYYELIKASPQVEESLKVFEQQKDAIASVASSIDGAFKGMLTAGMSWRDGMKGIIEEVINQLWKMYVTQQIVGFITSSVGKIFGLPSVPKGATFDQAFPASMFPARAIGGPVQSGQPYMVGERGPEMFVPSRSGSIIPNNAMGNGMVINVDARGSADPAAVRAQVQQGILEAAPAIIAAAEQRTITGLRRPRLGGVMQ